MSLFRDLLIDRKRRRYFCEVEYLESIGTQYINTGILPTQLTKAQINMQFTDVNYKQSVLGSNNSQDQWNNLFGTNENSSPNKPTVFWCQWGMTYDGGFTKDTNRHTHTFERNGDTSWTYTVDTTSKTITSGITTQTDPKVMYLFACNNNGTLYRQAKVKLYYCKIWNNGVLVRDFIPVLDWDMTPCMYDKVSGQLFYNQGTGSFTAGRQIHPVEYLESTGTQYINTGLLSTASSQVDVLFGFSSMESGSANNCAVFGGRNNTMNQTFTFFKLATGNPQYFRFDYNGQITVGTASQMTWNTSSVYRFEYDGSTAKSTNITTGQSESVSRSPGSSFTTSPILLFAVGTNTQAGQFMSGRIYKYWYTDGTNTIDLIPAIDENGVGFMFDTVSHTCFLNDGTGNFAYPPVELEYLESTGTQYINTGYKPNTNTECSIDFMFNAIDSTYRTPFSIRTSDGAADSFTVSGASTVQNAYAFGYNQWWDGNGGCPMPVIGTKYNGTLKSGRATFGNVVGNAGTTITPSSLTAYMFARNANGTASNFFKGRIYDCQLKENGTLVRDYIPCLKDGVAGMLDKANNVFYPNAGTGTFVAGSVIEPKFE